MEPLVKTPLRGENREGASKVILQSDKEHHGTATRNTPHTCKPFQLYIRHENRDLKNTPYDLLDRGSTPHLPVPHFARISAER